MSMTLVEAVPRMLVVSSPSPGLFCGIPALIAAARVFAGPISTLSRRNAVLTEWAVAYDRLMSPYDTPPLLPSGLSRPGSLSGLAPLNRLRRLYPFSSAATRPNALKLEPPCGAAWVAAL